MLKAKWLQKQDFWEIYRLTFWSGCKMEFLDNLQYETSINYQLHN